MKLYVYNISWDSQLPSFCPECVGVLLYLKNVMVDIEIDFSGNQSVSKNGKLPVLEWEGKRVYGFKNIVDFFERQGVVIECFVPEHEIIPFEGILGHLKMIYQYLWFYDEDNYRSYTYHHLSTSIPFPSNIFRPKTIRTARIEEMEMNDLYVADDMVKITDNYFRILDTKLKFNDYIFGDELTKLDCIIFGYLTCIVSPRFKSPQKFYPIQYKNVFDYVNKMNLLYFNELPYSPISGNRLHVEKKKKRKKIKKEILTEKEQTLVSRTNSWVLYSGLILCFYAVAYNKPFQNFLAEGSKKINE